MDIFTQNLWTERELLETVNREPFVPGLISGLFPWKERGLTTTVAYLDSYDGQISLIPSTPRGGVPIMHRPSGRTANPVPIPHFAIADHINADEIQNVLSRNNPQALQTITEERNQRIAEITPKLDLTIEHLRFGAINGLVVDGAGITLANIYTLTGQSQHAEVNLGLGGAAGTVKQGLIDLRRIIMRALRGDGARVTGIVIIGDAALVDNFRKSIDYVAAQSFDSRSGALNEATDRIEWLGFTFIEYEPGDFGPSGANNFFATGKGIAVPTGPGLDIFRTYYAPGDWLDTVNTRALPRYMREYQDPRGKGIDLEFQTNPLPFVTRPEALIRVDDGVS